MRTSQVPCLQISQNEDQAAHHSRKSQSGDKTTPAFTIFTRPNTRLHIGDKCPDSRDPCARIITTVSVINSQSPVLLANGVISRGAPRDMGPPFRWISSMNFEHKSPGKIRFWLIASRWKRAVSFCGHMQRSHLNLAAIEEPDQGQMLAPLIDFQSPLVYLNPLVLVILARRACESRV